MENKKSVKKASASQKRDNQQKYQIKFGLAAKEQAEWENRVCKKFFTTPWEQLTTDAIFKAHFVMRQGYKAIKNQ